MGRPLVSCERHDGGDRLIELKSVLEHRAIDEAAVRAGVAQLDSECVLERLPREVRVRIEEAREAPEHRIAIPVSGGYVVPGAARSHADELFRIERASPGK